MVIFGDCHLGAARRSKWLYNKIRNTFETQVKKCIDEGEDVIFAGDVWDVESPRPNDLDLVQRLLVYGKDSHFIFIPGNHDRIGMEGVCAADLFRSENVDVFTSPQCVEIGTIKFHFVPYSADILEVLKDYTEKHVDENDENILVSHFSTNESNSFAGIISEDDEVFKKYKAVIIGDTHCVHDSGKFHTTCSTYFTNVDEMYSDNCIPGYIKYNEMTGGIQRVSVPELNPVFISSEDEAIDENTLYMIVSSEPVNIIKSNVFVKYKPVKEDEVDEALKESIEMVELSGGVNKSKIFGLMYPEMSDTDKRSLSNFESGAIDIEGLINNESPNVKKAIDEPALDGYLEGNLFDESF